MALVSVLRRDVDGFRRAFGDFFQSGSLADLEAVCSDGKIRLHQFVLAAASPVLAQEFANPRISQEDGCATLLLPDFSKSEVTFNYSD